MIGTCTFRNKKARVARQLAKISKNMGLQTFELVHKNCFQGFNFHFLFLYVICVEGLVHGFLFRYTIEGYIRMKETNREIIAKGHGGRFVILSRCQKNIWFWFHLPNVHDEGLMAHSSLSQLNQLYHHCLAW